MAELQLSGRKVSTVFNLLGSSENDMTYSLGWCLANVPEFLKELGKLLGSANLSQDALIKLQEYDRKTGITDIEIYSPGRAAWVIEAKRGFTVPKEGQLSKYAARLNNHKDAAAHKGLAVLAQSDRKEQWLSRQLCDDVDGIPVSGISWRQVKRAANKAAASASHSDTRLLKDLIKYLDEVANMKNETSNEVYVVSLNRATFGGKTTFLDVVEKHRKYFHPVGGGGSRWPSEPPNYIAFRYDARLQSIHHVEDYEVITDFGPYFPDQPSEERDPHFLYCLGAPIRPTKTTPTGAKWRSNRVWCFIDLLLTCDTIKDALDATRERVE